MVYKYALSGHELKGCVAFDVLLTQLLFIQYIATPLRDDFSSKHNKWGSLSLSMISWWHHL
jgi:hypothetical protein